MLRRLFSLAVFGLLVVPAGALAEEWTPLFDGKSLDGWQQKGGAAKYRIEDDEIVGTSVPNTEQLVSVHQQELWRLHSGARLQGRSEAEQRRADSQPGVRRADRKSAGQEDSGRPRARLPGGDRSFGPRLERRDL